MAETACLEVRDRDGILFQATSLLYILDYFTREDVRWLRGICTAHGPATHPIGTHVADDLADRIEALLPPERS